MKLGYISYNINKWQQDEFPYKEYNERLIDIVNRNKPNEVLNTIEEYIADINGILGNRGKDILSFFFNHQ